MIHLTPSVIHPIRAVASRLAPQELGERNSPQGSRLSLASHDCTRTGSLMVTARVLVQQERNQGTKAAHAQAVAFRAIIDITFLEVILKQEQGPGRQGTSLPWNRP